MSIDTQDLKQNLTPETFYSARLSGSWGKSTGQGWHSWQGLCPFHQDTKPGSFVINKQTGAFKCFACDASGGDIIDFHMQVTGLGFIAAVTQLRGTLR